MLSRVPHCKIMFRRFCVCVWGGGALFVHFICGYRALYLGGGRARRGHAAADASAGGWRRFARYCYRRKKIEGFGVMLLVYGLFASTSTFYHEGLVAWWVGGLYESRFLSNPSRVCWPFLYPSIPLSLYQTPWGP